MTTWHSAARPLALAAGFAVLLAADAGAQSAVPYPDGYSAWRHVKSMVILPGHALADPFAGVHHVYGNDQAMRGLASGAYADGAVFVFDLLEGGVKDNAVVEGPRKLIGVMRRDAKTYAATGGWGFEGFAGDSRDKRLAADGGKSCFACHEQRKDKTFVFTEARK
ncbi:MAG: cytochrome P460 family protein [Rhodospirillales bacterium]|nr:cytochrome P460 family protein [Rhodospirillales bacterium]